MKLHPTQYYLLIEICDIKVEDRKIITVDGKPPQVMPYGKVIEAGPDCKFCRPGDAVLFNLENLTIGFENVKQFIIVEGSVFAKLELEEEQEVKREHI